MPSDWFSVVEPHASGHLPVGGHHIAWASYGNPQGKPAVVLHGGPGQGCVPQMIRGFDPSKYRVILYDQRGCGRSRPHASELSGLENNTTEHLLGDLEVLRSHLRINRWLVCGGSWGCTLGVTYALQHSARVSELVLSSVTLFSRSEIDWLYRGLARFFPEAHHRFQKAVPSSAPLLESYVQQLANPDPAVHLPVARAWCAWEDVILSLEPRPIGKLLDLPDPEILAFARICAWYAHHGAWLEDLLASAHRLSGTPGLILHGRLDLTCPAETAFRLAEVWKGVRLEIDNSSGHGGSPYKKQVLLEYLNEAAS